MKLMAVVGSLRLVAKISILSRPDCEYLSYTIGVCYGGTPTCINILSSFGSLPILLVLEAGMLRLLVEESFLSVPWGIFLVFSYVF